MADNSAKNHDFCDAPQNPGLLVDTPKEDNIFLKLWKIITLQ
jgi:hypothetical protein